MFKHLLVPLDGSQLAESALAPAEYLVRKLESEVTLLHVIEVDAPSEVHSDRHLTNPKEAEDYLRELATRIFQSKSRSARRIKIKVNIHVHLSPVKDVARSIVEHARDEFTPDLIITCTHGRGGVKNLFYGSIAQQIVNQGTTPTLMIKPGLKPFQLKRILIPLDPDSAHDDSLPIARSVATPFDAQLLLLSVVPTLTSLAGEQAAAGNLMPVTAQKFLEMREENTNLHLQEHIDEFKGYNLRVKAQVARGDPANAIVKEADRLKADLILLSTHGRAGANAFWARSVAPNVARKTTLPVMLFRLSKSKENHNKTG